MKAEKKKKSGLKSRAAKALRRLCRRASDAWWSARTSLAALSKAWQYYRRVFSKNDWDDESSSLYRLVLYKLKRMQKSLQAFPYIDYEKECRSLDLAVGLLEIYLSDDFKTETRVNVRNAARFISASPEMLERMYGSEADRDRTEILGTEVDLKQMRLADLRKAKAFHLFHEVMELSSENWAT